MAGVLGTVVFATGLGFVVLLATTVVFVLGGLVTLVFGGVTGVTGV